MKEYKGTMQMSATSKKTVKSDVVVFSNDIDSFKFVYNLLDDNDKNLDLTTVDDIFFTLFFGGTDIKKHPKATLTGIIEDVEQVRVSLIIPKMFLGFVGTVYCEINLSYKNKQSNTVGRFSFKMSESLIDEGASVADVIYVQKFEDIKKEVEKKVEAIDDLLLGIEPGSSQSAESRFVSKEQHEQDVSNIQDAISVTNETILETKNLVDDLKTNLASKASSAELEDLKKETGRLQASLNKLQELNIGLVDKLNNLETVASQLNEVNNAMTNLASRCDNLQGQISYNYNVMVQTDNSLSERIKRLE